MTMYQPGVPTGTVPLKQDYQNLQNNFSQLNTTYQTDHVALTEVTNNGYHKIVRLVPQATPSAITGIGQFFNSTVDDGINTDQTFYFLTGDNRLMQLTRNFQPVSGATFLPGGLILNYGVITTTTTGSFASGVATGTITFTQSFPSNIYAIIFTLGYNSTIASPGSSGSVQYDTSSFAHAAPFPSINWQFRSNSSQFTGFSYVAIGK